MDFEKMYGEQLMKGFAALEYSMDYTPKKKAAGKTAARRERAGTETKGTNPYGTSAALLSRYTPKTKEEIIESGTARERAALRVADFEASQTLNCERLMTDSEVERLKSAARTMGTNEEWWEYLRLIDLFDSLSKYEREMTAVYRATQAEEAELAILCNVWETLQSTADRYTELWERVRDDRAASKETRDFIKDTLMGYASEGAEFYFDAPYGKFRVMVEGKGMLYERILKKAGQVGEKLAVLRAVVSVVADFIYFAGDVLVPYETERTIAEIWDESYARSLLYSPKYLRGGIIEKHRKGEEITEEDEFFAVFPCYFEVKESRDAREIYGKVAEKLHLTTSQK